MRSCAQRRHIKWMGNNPPSLGMYFFGGVRVFMALKALPAMMHHHKIEVFWRPWTPQQPPKNISACLGGYRPSIWHVGAEQKVSCGALGGHFCRQWLWLAMVVIVDVSHWRRTSDQPTVGIVKNDYGSILFYSYIDPIHSWHLTRQLNKEDLDLRTLTFKCFLCPIFYGSKIAWQPKMAVLSRFWGQKMNPSHGRNWYCVPKTPVRNYLQVLGTVIAP